MYVAYLSQVVLPVSLTCNSLCLIFYDPCAKWGVGKKKLASVIYKIVFYILLKIQHSKCSFKILIDRFYYKFFQTVRCSLWSASNFFMTFAQVFIASKDSFPTIQYNLIMANIDTVTMKNIMKNFEFMILIKIFKR